MQLSQRAKSKNILPKIPGLPLKHQAKALDRQKKKEKSKNSNEKKERSVLDFINLIEAKKPFENPDITSPTSQIPDNCKPGPIKSNLGQMTTAKSHRGRTQSLNSLSDTSPSLRLTKRNAADMISSPSSEEIKKTRSDEESSS